MRRLITLLSLILIAVTCLGVVYGFTVKGTIYVISGKTVLPLNKVVSSVSSYWVTVENAEGAVVAKAEIYPNSSFVVKGLNNSETYIFYLSSEKGSVLMLINNTFGILVPAKLQIPPYGYETERNFYVRYSDLEKILVVVTPKPVMKYSVVQFLPEKLYVGKEYYVKVNVSNVGKAAGEVCLKLYANTTLMSSKCVTVKPGSYVLVTLPVKFTTTGVYVVKLYANTTLLKQATVTVVKPPVVKIAKISVKVVTPLPKTLIAGKVYYMKIELTNTGNGTGTVTVAVYVNTTKISEEKVTVEPGATKYLVVPVNITKTGTYVVKVYCNTSLVFTETVKVITRPTKPYASITIPSTFYLYAPKPVCLTLINIYNKTMTFNVTVVGYVNESVVAGKNSKIVTLKPGESVRVCVPLTFEKYGESPLVVVYLNGKEIAEKPVKLEKVPVVVIGAKRTYVVLVGGKLNLPIALEDIKGYAIGIELRITFNSSVLTVPVSEKDAIVNEVRKCFHTTSLYVMADIGKGSIGIVVAGYGNITVNVCKFNITFHAVNVGKSLINASKATISLPNGSIISMGVVPTLVVVKKAVYVPKIVGVIVKPLPKTMIMKREYELAVKISNIGNATGTAMLVVTVNGTMIFRSAFKLEPGMSKVVSIPVMIAKPGTYVIHVKVNGTDVEGSPMIVKVVRVIPYKIVSITIPEVFYVGIKTSILMTVMDNSTRPITLILAAQAIMSGKVVSSATEKVTIEPGKTVTVELPLVFNKTGTGIVEVFVNGTLVEEKTVKVEKIPPYAVYVSLIPKMHVYWAGYPVMLNVTVIPRVKAGVAINITVVEVTPYSEKIIATLFKPLVVGEKYNITKRVILPTYTTTGEFIVYVNGVPMYRMSFMTTGVAVVVKPNTYELISVPILPLSYITTSQSIPTPPPGSAPVKLPTLAQVFSLAYDVETGEKIYPWNLVSVYYYDRTSSSIPYYVAISPTTTPVRPGTGLVIYSEYPHEIVLIAPINVTAISADALKILLEKTLALAYIPSPFTPGWALVGPIGLVPIKLMPSKVMNVTLYYTETTNSSSWTIVEPVSVGEYVYPGKGYWIFWDILTYHAIHGEMMYYLKQYFSVLNYAKICK